MTRSIIALMFITFTIKGFSCSCISYPEPKAEQLFLRDAIFKGEVISVDTIQDVYGYLGTFKVGMLVQHRVVPKTLPDTVYVTSENSSCGIYFRTGETWMVFADNYRGFLDTHQCLPVTKNNVDQLVRYYSKLRKSSTMVHEESEDVNGLGFMTGELRNGVPEGKWYRVIGNDTTAIYNLKNGEMYGRQITKEIFDKDDIFEEIVVYEGGKRNGIKRTFGDGKLNSVTPFKDGQKHGFSIKEYSFYTSEGMYRHGKKIGIWLQHNESTIKSIEVYDENGVRISKTCYDEEGNVIDVC